MSCIDYGPNGTNTDEHGLNRANKYSPREEVDEDAKSEGMSVMKNSQRKTRSLLELLNAWVELQLVQLN